MSIIIITFTRKVEEVIRRSNYRFLAHKKFLSGTRMGRLNLSNNVFENLLLLDQQK